MRTSLTLAAAAVVLAAAVPALGADIAVTPPTIALSLTPGASASTLAGVSVNNPPPRPYAVVLQMRASGGSLPASWLASKPATITNTGGPQQLPLVFAIPAAAAPGTYTAVLQPVVLSSSIPLGPTLRGIVATVTVAALCNATPTVALATSGPVQFWPPNGRLEDAAVTGRFEVPQGCALEGAWYVLEDEYGTFGAGGEVVAAADGSYALSVPLQVSREGGDADGRTYRLTVYARDEAGVGASAPLTFTVPHDKGKK